ncbi:MAG: hypothetical protein U0269_28525 [Polyangiales bacterium]
MTTTGDELKALRSAEARALRDALGECRVLARDEEPDLLGTFRADPMAGEHWTKALSAIEWLFEEADGGAIGRYRKAPKTIVYVDNEGQWTLSPTLIDHLRSKDWDDAHKKTIEAFAKKHGLPAPLTKAARKAAVKDIETPEQVVNRALATANKSEKKTEKNSKTPAKSAANAPAVEKGPRPLCRMIIVTRAPDGTVHTLSGEDFGGAYGEKITRGATFRFDEGTSSFVKLAQAPVGAYDEDPNGWWALFRFGPERCLEGDHWRARPTVAVPAELRKELTALRARDKSWFVATRGRLYSCREDKIELVATTPARDGERIIELSDGRLLLAHGQVSYRTVLQSTIVDPHKRTAVAGPELPGEYGTLFASKGRAALLHGYNDSKTEPAALSVFDGGAWSKRAPPAGLYDERGSLDYVALCELSDGTLLMHSHRTMQLARLDIDALTIETVGALRVNSSAQGVELADGRVLVVGGTLFNNVDAEPELWNPKTRATSALPGYEKELEKQVKALEKFKEKERAKRER